MTPASRGVRIIVGETSGKRIQVLTSTGSPLQLISMLRPPFAHEEHLTNEALIAFGTAVDEGDLHGACAMLERLELTSETESMWEQLSQLALQREEEQAMQQQPQPRSHTQQLQDEQLARNQAQQHRHQQQQRMTAQQRQQYAQQQQYAHANAGRAHLADAYSAQEEYAQAQRSARGGGGRGRGRGAQSGQGGQDCVLL